MKIFVIGATGMAGSAIVKEAIAKNIDVVANGRNVDKLQALQNEHAAIEIVVKDALALTKADFKGVDVIVDAFATVPEKAYLHVDLATKLIAMFRAETAPRLAFILGAGSLIVGEGKNQYLAVKDIEADASTLAWRAIPQNQLKELNFLRDVDNVDWFGISPSLNFVPGEVATTILHGTDQLLVNTKRDATTTAGTMAVAMVSEILSPQHHQARFTVANG
ncbi:NAD(P)-dependent oxidoreductase [Periweissella beninensis]|uniref:NAD(P)-dependent oxidoreductase n=1 Tax=Periweissella beninensis TaxID=504936 RepID=UPI0021A53622|nr:NAD(P)H-binding protein [Periweissella beninensis]MCT4396467.1 NAD-dependent epimerase/dehydratase family protein [Periweissella beninensis]